MSGPTSFPNATRNARIAELNRLSREAEQRSPADDAQVLQQLDQLDPYQLAANWAKDRDPSTMSELEQFVHRGDQAALEAKYGSEIASRIRQQVLEGHRAVLQDTNVQRSGLEAGVDLATAFPQSVLQTGTGILGTAGGLINERLGTAIAGTGQAIDDGFSSVQSERLNASRRLHQARLAVDEREHQLQAEREIEAGGSSLLAHSKRIGRDIVSGVLSNLQDPVLVGQGATDAAASMLTAGGMTSILKGLGQGLVKGQRNLILNQLKTGEITKEMADKAISALDKKITGRAFGLSVGAMEGGGSFQDTALDVMSRTPEELMRTSAPYREKVQELVKEGVSAEEAQIQAQRWLANRAGLRTAAIQGTAGAIVSRLAMGGAQPLKLRPSARGTLGALARDTGEETLEESTQGLTGTLAKNLTMQQLVDPDQDLLEGVGTSIGEGGLFGALSPGMLKAPGAALRLPGQAVRLGVATKETLAARSERIREEQENASPVGAPALIQGASTLQGRASSDLEVMQRAVDGMEASQGEKSQAKRQLSSLVQAFQLGPTEFEELLPEGAKKELASSSNRIDAIERTAKLLLKAKEKEEKTALALHLMALQEPLREHMADPSFVDGILADPEAERIRSEYAQVILNYHNTPAVRKGLIKAREAVGVELTPEELAILEEPDSSPQAQQLAHRVVAQAILEPGSGNLQAAEQVLKHAEGGKLNLTPSQLTALQGSLALLRAREILNQGELAQTAQEANKSFGEVLHSKHLQRELIPWNQVVSTEITTGREGKDGGAMPSALQHVEMIVQAVQAGNIQLAQKYLQDLASFTLHMQNKVQALNESHRLGGRGVAYQQLLPDRSWADSSTNPNQKHRLLFVNAKSPDSIAHAKLTALEAKFLHDVLSGLVQAFPELKGKVPTLQELRLDLQETPQDNRERLLSDYQKLSPKERIQRFYRDTNTRILNQRGFERLPPNPNRPMVAHLSVEGIKYVNDKRSHEEADAVYAIVGKALGEMVPDAAKIGGDLAIRVKDQAQLDRVLKRLNALPELQGLRVTGAVGKTFFEAGRAHGALKAGLETEGKRAPRGSRPFGLVEDNPFQRPEMEGDRPLPKGLEEAFDKLSPEEQAEIIYFEEGGLLTNEGLWALPKKKHRISLDVDFLKAINDRYGSEVGDRILEAVSELAVELGASAQDLAHVSGDEYRGQSDSVKELEQFAQKLVEEAERRISLEATNVKTGKTEIIQGVGISFGIGTTDEQADQALNRAKEERAAQGLRGEGAFERRVRETEEAGRGEPAGSEVQGPSGRETVPAEEEVEGKQEPAWSQEELEELEERVQENFDFEFSSAGLRDFFGTVVERASNMLGKVFRIRAKDGKPTTRTLGLGANALSRIRTALQSQEELNELKGKASEKAYKPEIAAEYGRLLQSDPEVRKGLMNTLRRAQAVQKGKKETDEEFAERKAKILEPVQNAGALMVVMNAHLQAFLNRKGVREKLLSGEVERWLVGKALNVVELLPDGKARYQPELFQGAVLAGLQWWLTMGQRESHLHDDDIKAITKMENPPKELANLLDQGMGTAQAVRSLAPIIARFWGVQGLRDKDLAYTEGIPGAVAGEVIRALIALGMLQEVRVPVGQYKEIPDDEVIIRLVATKRDLGKNPIYAYPTVIEEAVVVEPEAVAFYGPEAKIPVAKHQLGNKRVKLSKRQRKALRHRQEQAYTLNMPMARWMDAMGIDALVDLFSTYVEDETHFNRNHLESVKGQNLQLVGAFREFERIRNEMALLAETQEISIEEVQKRYAYEVTNVNRMMMTGRYNPQASKLMRELLLPTWSTLDLSDPSGKHFQHFYLAVGQALDFIKLNRNSRSEVVSQTLAKVKGDLAPAIDLLADWAKEEKGSFPHTKLKRALQEAGITPTPLAVHALMDLARLQNAEDRTSFRTALYLEADGMTNGPFNTLGLLSFGEFVSEWVENAKRGGVHFGSEAKPADELLKEAGTDLYETTTIHAKNAIGQMMRAMRTQENGSSLLRQTERLYDALSLLDMDISLSQGEDGKVELSLKRGAAKSPMTVTVYGSGESGLANQITKELTTAFYAKLSDGIQAVGEGKGPWEGMFPKDSPQAAKAKYDRLMGSMDALVGTTVGLGKNGYFLQDQGRKVTSRLQDVKGLERFTFSADNQKAIGRNLQTLFVKPMREGIFQTLGKDIRRSGDLIRGATQVQSVVLRALYEQAIEKKLAEKGADPEKHDWKRGDFLSQKELDEVMEDLAEVMPDMVIDSQPFHVAKESALELEGKNKRGEGFRPEFSRALDESLRTPANVFAPANAGVSGIPKLVIGMGDGRMICVFYQEPMEGTLDVYDGINLPIDKIEEYGRAANQAALAAWQGNVFQGLGKAFDRFLSNKRVIEELQTNDELVLELARTLRLFPPKEEVTALQARQALEGFLNQTAKEIDERTLEIQARRAVIGQANLSVDQMASASSPHLQEGTLQFSPHSTSEEIATRLNEEYHRVLKKLKDGRPVTSRQQVNLFPKAEATPKAEEKKPLPSLAPALKGGKLHRSGVRVLGKTAINKLVRSLEVTPHEKEVVGELLRSKALEGWQIVAGTHAQVAAYQASQGISTGIVGKEGETVLGAAVESQRTIFLMTDQTETVVHELVHAATYATVLAHFRGEDLGPRQKEIGEAVTRLERLKDLFLETTFDTEGDPELETALSNTANAILQHDLDLSKPEAERKAAALNEFMAWTLSNRALAEQLSLSDLPSTPQGRLARIAKSAYQALKKLIWGRRTAPKFGLDVLSQIRFNTAIITRAQPSLSELVRENSQFALLHAVEEGRSKNPRLAEIQEVFERKILNRIQGSPLGTEFAAETRVGKSLAQTVELVQAARRHFTFTPEEETTFELIVTALATEAQLAPQAMNETNRLFTHILQTLGAEDFVPSHLAPGTQAFEDARMQHVEKVNFLLGKELQQFDAQGRSSLLPVFLGLALTNEEFRSVLSRMDVPKAIRQEGAGLDGFLEHLGSQAMDRLSERMAGVKQPAHVQQAIDQLSERMVTLALRERDKLTLNRGTNALNRYLVRALERLGETAGTKGDELRQEGSSGLERAAGAFLKGIAALASDDQNAIVSQELMGLVDRTEIWPSARELIRDLVGRTEDVGKVYDMAKEVKATVSRLRQDFREVVPRVIRGKFETQPTAEEWDFLHRAMGRYDMASLSSLRQNTKELLALVTNEEELQGEIARLEETLKEAHPPQQWDLINKKMKQLVHFMRTGEAGPNLLSNAYAISRLFGEVIDKKWSVPAPETVQAIDQLVTLRLLSEMSKWEKKTLSELVERENQGMEFVLDYLQGQRKTEMAKAGKGPAQINHFKGHLPSERKPQGRLIVDLDERAADLRALGYQRVGPYRGSNIESGKASRSYYFAPEMQQTPFSQGVVQNIDHTASGVHEFTGYSTGITAGRIVHPVVVQEIAARMAMERNSKENLRPIYNSIGVVVAFERMVDPTQLKLLEQAQDLPKMIGQWRGRQLEEELAHKINERLVEHLREMYDEDLKASGANQEKYVNLFKSKDPVIQEAVKLFPPELRAQIDAKFPQGFFVRKSLVNDVIGYRNPTVGDFWTETGRWSPEVEKGVRDTLTSILGIDAYQRLVKLERNVQSVVHAAKTNIVVRSVIVPTVNLVSNYLQLLGRGMGPVEAAKALAAKTAEIHAYTKSLLRLVEIEAELQAAEGGLRNQRLEAEKQAIEDSHKRLSIWPLIQAGEFSTIADLGTAQEDLHLSGGNWTAYLTKKVDELPPGILRELARQGYLAKDTSLFQGLQKMVQYGDFIAKAALYDHYTEKMGMTKRKALARITEEFINYDILPGRTRGYLESIGALWFYNYKLRAVKVGQSMMRNNPLQAIMASFVPYPMGLGTPVTENLFAKLFEGTLGYSVGPGMVMQGLGLHPTYNLLAD